MSFKNKVNISVLISLLSVILLLFVLGVYAQDNSTVITNGTDINTTSVNNTNDSVREVNVHNWNELKTAVDNLTDHPCEKLVINLDDGDYKINTAEIQVKRVKI